MSMGSDTTQHHQVGDTYLTSDPGEALPLDRWVVDTGSAFDLVGQAVGDRIPERIRPSRRPFVVQTANGTTHASSEISAGIQALDISVTVNILAGSPPLLSVGRRCMHDGMSFVWPAGSDPYFILRTGQKVPLRVDGYVPYLASGTRPVDVDQDLVRALREDMVSVPVISPGTPSADDLSLIHI